MAATVEPPSLSSLPDEILVTCLAQVSRSYYRSLSLVSKTFRSFLSSPELVTVRSQIGNIESCLYLCLQSPKSHRWFTLEQTPITEDGETKVELSLAPIIIPPSSSNPPTPSDSTTVAVGSEMYQLSKRSSAVRVFDCRSHTWRCAPNMLLPRKHAKCVSLEEKIYVIGGYKSVDWGEVFDVKNQTWKLLPSPGDKLDPKHKVIVFGGMLYIITKNHNYAYDPKEEQWTRTDEWLGLSLSFARNLLCVIENLLVYDDHGRYWCYDVSSEKRFFVKGLEDLYMKRGSDYYAMQLLNIGGKLVTIWHEGTKHGQSKRMWCAVIKLKMRESELTKSAKRKKRKPELELWGEIERFNVVVPSGPKSYELLSCQSVSLD